MLDFRWCISEVYLFINCMLVIGDTPLHILTRSRDQQGIDKLLRLFRNPADIIDTQVELLVISI